LVLFVLILLLIIQMGLFYWKKNRYSSFRNVTFIGLWIFPAISSYYSGFWRHLLIWSVFSFYTSLVIRKARKSPIAQTTPRSVYGWFYRVYRICYMVSIFGVILFFIDFFGICIILSKALNYNICGSGLIYLFYGIYYGVMGRDCAEICAETMASSMGINTKKENTLPSVKFNPNICCICGSNQGNQDLDPIVTLECSHSFHDFCIRGWTIIGKKDVCPYCMEKVELRKVFSNPWTTASIFWNNILDSFRYIIVWNPIIIYFLNSILIFLDPPPTT